MAENMFDGFDHTQYKDEVEQRWGKDAYARSDAWWRGMDAAEKAAWKARVEALGRDWIAAAESGVAPDSDEAQDLARRHVEWLTGIPGTPAAAPGRRREGVRHRSRRDVRRRPALRRELRRPGGCGVRARRAAHLRGRQPVIALTRRGERMPEPGHPLSCLRGGPPGRRSQSSETRAPMRAGSPVVRRGFVR